MMMLGLKTILQIVQVRKDLMQAQIRKLQKVKAKATLVQIPDHQMKLEQLKLKLAAARPMPALPPVTIAVRPRRAPPPPRGEAARYARTTSRAVARLPKPEGPRQPRRWPQGQHPACSRSKRPGGALGRRRGGAEGGAAMSSAGGGARARGRCGGGGPESLWCALARTAEVFWTILSSFLLRRERRRVRSREGLHHPRGPLQRRDRGAAQRGRRLLRRRRRREDRARVRVARGVEGEDGVPQARRRVLPDEGFGKPVRGAGAGGARRELGPPGRRVALERDLTQPAPGRRGGRQCG